MAIGKISGVMLQTDLARQGVNLSLDGNLAYFDVTNRRLGVSTASPAYTLDVNGNAQLGNIVIYNNTITSTTGKINLGNISNLTVTGGTVDSIVYTDGNGNLAFGTLQTLAGLEGFTGNNILIGTTVQSNDGFGTNALTTGLTIADAIGLLDDILGNITNRYGNVITTGNLFYTGGALNNILSTNGSGITTWVDANTVPAISTLIANASAQAVSINSLNANIGAYELWANAAITNYETWANTAIQSTQANLGAYQIYANANIGTITNTLQSIQSNVGAFELYANANIGTLYLGNISTNANLGAYQIYANANAATQAVSITSLATGANANTAAYLTTYTGNITAGNITAVYYGNVYADTITPYKTTVTTFSSSTAVGLPIGGNVARPSSPQSGQIRYNSDFSTVEFYNGVAWISVISNIDGENFSGDGSRNVFTLKNGTTQNGILVSINGTVQQPGYAYTVVGNQITFAEIPLVTDQIDIRYLAAAAAIDNNITSDVTVTGNITLSGILQSPLTTKTSTSTGTAGQVCYDANYIYVCTATNTWKRVALTGGVF